MKAISSCLLMSFHLIVGAGKTDGAMDAGNMLEAYAGERGVALYRGDHSG